MLRNIREALDAGIYMMTLCTINRFNIQSFFRFADALYREYQPYVDCGQLVMPAHYITGYTTTVGLPSPEQAERFATELIREIPNNPILANVDWHYQKLAEYAVTRRHDDCQVERWSRCCHFLGNQIVGEGIMNSYLCAMRGYGDLGTFSAETPPGQYRKIYAEQYKKVYSGGRCSCFVDWTAFDSVLRGDVPLSRAEKWFGFFRDKRVKDWITAYQKENV